MQLSELAAHSNNTGNGKIEWDRHVSPEQSQKSYDGQSFSWKLPPLQAKTAFLMKKKGKQKYRDFINDNAPVLLSLEKIKRTWLWLNWCHELVSLKTNMPPYTVVAHMKSILLQWKVQTKSRSYLDKWWCENDLHEWKKHISPWKNSEINNKKTAQKRLFIERNMYL